MTAFSSAYPGTIKSIQRGIIDMNTSTSATATITAVVTAKTELRYLGIAHGDGLAGARISLTNSTTITGSTGSTSSAFLSWELTEFN